MCEQRKACLALGVCLAMWGGGWGSQTARAEAQGPAIRIGLIATLFRDLPEPMVLAAMGPFRALMEAQIGLRGELSRSEDAFALGRDLCADKLQLGVFHGFEFAWAKKKYPELRPLVIAINQQQILHVYVLVPQNSPARNLADLKGQALALPNRTREHSRLFLERACLKDGKEFPEFFAKITKPDCAEDALDDVVDGLVSAVVVDGVSLDCYQRRKPGRFARLRVLLKSTSFPAAVVAYHAGALDGATLERFQTGMLLANKNAFGRQLLTLWQMTGFERVPAGYQETLDAIAKTYPPPAAGKEMKPVAHPN